VDARGSRGDPRRLIGRVVAWTATAASLLTAAGVALAASPDPTPAAAAGDPRSTGQGPGLVGDPLLAIGLVLLVAVASLVLTLAYVRLTSD
jgi:hypothetical protein